jgi:DNA polymerase III subunit epsilon
MWNWLKKPVAVHQLVLDYEKEHRLDKQQLASNAHYLVLDFETTGLDAKKHHIVSAGWVKITSGRIPLNSANYQLVKSPVSVGQSAVFHGLHNSQLQQGVTLEELLTALLNELRGAVLVSHHSALELSFLKQSCQNCFGRSPAFKAVDTLKLELYKMQLKGGPVVQNSLSLPACLARYQLPEVTEHHALSDAFACAQLFLAQLKSRGASCTLAELFHQSR